MFSTTRFIAATSSQNDTDESDNKPLPQGLCGGPVINADGKVCGVVEGIVPMNHPDPTLAGAAAFIPVHVLKTFVDFAGEYKS